MRLVFKTAVAALTIIAGSGAWTPSHACDINSATDLSCGPMSVNPANPLSPLNPMNQQHANSFNNQNSFYSPTNPYSPYFSTPVYAYGILGLLEGEHPTIIYPAGPPRTCRLGIDCPQSVDGSRTAEAAYPASEPTAEGSTVMHARHHRKVRHAR